MNRMQRARRGGSETPAAHASTSRCGLRTPSSATAYERYARGPHHLAFHAASREVVDRDHGVVHAIGATVLDAPADFGGQPDYTAGYYAAFFADPDGLKLEVVHLPAANP